jgi:hypothetical protein
MGFIDFFIEREEKPTEKPNGTPPVIPTSFTPGVQATPVYTPSPSVTADDMVKIRNEVLYGQRKPLWRKTSL